jgi:hypothetical protein
MLKPRRGRSAQSLSQVRVRDRKVKEDNWRCAAARPLISPAAEPIMPDVPSEMLRGVAPWATQRSWEHAELVTVDTRGPLRFVPLCEEPWGTFLHHDGRSWICLCNDSCQYCAAHVPRRWAGWWPACPLDARARWVVKVSYGASVQLQSLRLRCSSLRHLPLVFRRDGRSANSRVRVDLPFPRPALPSPLPPSFDPRGAVLTVHGWEPDRIASLLALPRGE